MKRGLARDPLQRARHEEKRTSSKLPQKRVATSVPVPFSFADRCPTISHHLNNWPPYFNKKQNVPFFLHPSAPPHVQLLMRQDDRFQHLDLGRQSSH
jgi:hypothetical protein